MSRYNEEIPNTIEELIEYADYVMNNHINRSSEDMIEVTLKILERFKSFGKENVYEAAQCKYALANFYFDINDVQNAINVLDDVINNVERDGDTILVIAQCCHLKAQCYFTDGQREECYRQLEQEVQILNESYESVQSMAFDILYDIFYDALIKLAAIDSIYHKDYEKSIYYESMALKVILDKENIEEEEFIEHAKNLSKDVLIKVQSNLTDMTSGFTRLKRWNDALKCANLVIELLSQVDMDDSQKAFRMKYNRVVILLLSGEMESAKEKAILLKDEFEKKLGKYNILTIRINELIAADYQINQDTFQLVKDEEEESDEKNVEEEPRYELITKDGIKDIYKKYKSIFRGILGFSDGLIVNEELFIMTDYTKLNDFKKLSGALKNVIMAMGQYDQADIMFLWLRELFISAYKPEIGTLAVLKDIVSNEAVWMNYLREMTKEIKNSSEELMYMMPYWLENERRLLCNNMHEDYDVELVRHIPCCLVKSNKVYARSKTLGKTTLIFIDSGMYFYLSEWTKAIFNGKWVREFMSTNPGCVITEPIKTISNFMARVVCVLEYQGSVEKVPIGGVCMGMPAAVRLRDAVKWMTCFIVGHEYGHILLNQSRPANKTEAFANEYAADELALNWIMKIQDVSVVKGINENDVSIKATVNEKLDYFEMLFLFYDMYDFFSKRVSKVMGNDSLRDNETHPSAKNRIKQLRKYSKGYYDKSLSNYANDLCEKVRTYVNEMKDDTFKDYFLNL